MDFPEIAKANGHYLYDKHGQAYYDLISGFGTVFLGHGEATVVNAVHQQMTLFSAVGRLPSEIRTRCFEAVNQLLPEGHGLDVICSTGMESNEYAGKLAAVVTGKQRFIAFENTMHGKSVFTSSLCWGNAPVKCGNNTLLPYPTDANEVTVLAMLIECLESGEYAGCYLEPLRGSCDGAVASVTFREQLVSVCRQFNVVSIFDETLTGLYRTGPLFTASELTRFPDILIFAKSIGNGVPASCVASNISPALHQLALKGSTFSDHPVTCAAIIATLEAISTRLDTKHIAEIDQVFSRLKPAFAAMDCKLQGRGLLWVLACGTEVQANNLFDILLSHHFLVSKFGHNLRFLPKIDAQTETIETILTLLLNANNQGA
ncbi:aminotransferase class III-fold pyridoxal phosphate-dependent enzyme [Aestuariibacter sp. GS-14]|uniref:aminotransferase class III-fold pyridoxal phosphate-dependent enzyme n=1 Tax=Aestuariibacter sp. GS-14 TaxID=2590670 RepID=UPI00112A36B4|nr:aminotransferase class III-fold pyridoxal phosphate-dependent enzyme [Aestuariibacter sp. GS-14]TPV55459.1 aminotransferase class III-fold pyridoxal phosphate-dependent enzyme [Aestuariibacter sp. GS-14]